LKEILFSYSNIVCCF